MPKLLFGRRFHTILVVCSVWAGLPTVAAAQNYSQIFASVVDQNGAPVLDLTIDDFSFKIGADPIELAAIRLAPTLPKIALLIDNGDSMYRLAADSPLRNGLAAFVEALDKQAELGYFTLAPQVRRREDFTTNREDVRETASGYFSEQEAGARMMDGFLETWKRRFASEDAWPVFILVMGPGEDRSSFVTENEYAEFLEDLIARGATVHAVCLTAGGGGLTPGHAHSLAQNLADNTGGRFLTVAAPSGLVDALTQLAEHMNYHAYLVSSRYQIVHEVPDNPSGDVSVNLSNLTHKLELFLNRRLPE